MSFLQKVQHIFEKEFFCDVNGAGKRSKTPPTSVHRLTPGDIDIVGAVGDSLTAGFGIFASNKQQLLLENRGVSWSIGGRDNWRKFLTLPNLIKVYNPKLYGYSEAAYSFSFQRESKFNVAELGKKSVVVCLDNNNNCPSEGAITHDMVAQAENLVKRMRSDPKVDLDRHWKVVTMMVGPNDFCFELCYNDNQEQLLNNAERSMVQALRIFRENLPRTLVNVVIPIGKHFITLSNCDSYANSLHSILSEGSLSLAHHCVYTLLLVLTPMSFSSPPIHSLHHHRRAVYLYE
jgi:hypothetical protein